MEKGLTILSQKVAPNKKLLLSQQYKRLINLIGEQNTIKMLQSMVYDDGLDLIANLDDQYIKDQFLFQEQLSQNRTNNKISSLQNLSNKIQKYEQLNPQRTFKPSSKHKSQQNYQQDSDYDRFIHQISDYLQEYKGYIDLSDKDMVEVIDHTFFIKSVLARQVLTKNQICKLVSQLKGNKPSQTNIYDYISLVDSALYHSSPSKNHLRETQILSLLFFLIRGNNRMILQILTGEGKSTTISCLAAILSISGLSVDIVTTNQLLATRDVEEKKIFYAIMGIQATHNFEVKYSKGKDCYKNNNVVYGTPHSFQVDILLNDYQKRGTRCGRKFEILIIDEADSMFIDQKQHQTLLASNFPGFSQLVQPMKIIWNKINMNPIFKKGDKFMMAMAYGNDATITGEIKCIMQEVVKDLRKQFKNEIISQWRMQFVEQSVQKWIQSAIKAAFVYKEDRQYIVRNGRILNVDYQNNGIIEQNVKLQDGVHQFLQIKHGLHVNIEGMTSNFISNLGHFDKYVNLYGLTGTLGSDLCKQFLKKTYRTEMFKIPPYKARKLLNQAGKVLYDQVEWARYISETIYQMILCERSVLILCLSIQEVGLLQYAIKNNRINYKRLQILKLGNQQIDDVIGCEQIIIATNLAGRGSDLKITEQLNRNGGLHVIISFMPINSRVEMQGRGRAGRNGCNGSSELAVNYTQYCYETNTKKEQQISFKKKKVSEVKTLIKKRDERQKYLTQMNSENVGKMRSKDKIFNLYCAAVNEIPDFHTKAAKQNAIEEKWAIFLKKIQNAGIDYELIEDQARKLIQKFKKNCEDFYNPHHEILLGLDQMVNNPQMAISHFVKAQQSQSGTVPQIIAGLFQNCSKIQLGSSKENKNYQSVQRGLKKVLENIDTKKTFNKAVRLIDIQNSKITNALYKKKNIEKKQFQNNFQNKILQIREELRLPQREDSVIKERNQYKIAQQFDQKVVEHCKKESDLNEEIKNYSSGQDRLLMALEERVNDIMNKSKMCKQGEYLNIGWVSSKKILQSISGHQQQNKIAYEKLRSEGFIHLPTANIVKKQELKISIRKLIFILGVAQAVIGCLIIASTGGSLAGFGITMITQGLKDCYNALFSPEQLQDIRQYFTAKTINYAASLAMSGLEGCKQLATLSKQGFEVLKDASFKQIVCKISSNMAVGVQKIYQLGNNCLRAQSLQKLMLSNDKTSSQLVSCGLTVLSTNLSGKDNKQTNELQNPVQFIKQNSDNLRKIINQKIKQQQKIDHSHQQIIQDFKIRFQIYLSDVILNKSGLYLPEIQNLSISSDDYQIIIKNALEQSLYLPKENSKVEQQVRRIFAQNILKANSKKQFTMQQLVIKFIEKIELQHRVEKCLKQISQSESYKNTVNNQIAKLIEKQINLILQQKLQMLKIKKKQVYVIRSQLKNSLREVERQNLKTLQKEYLKQKQLLEQFLPINHNIYGLLSTINSHKGIINGKLKASIIGKLNIHQYFKQAISLIQYSDSSKQFYKIFEISIYNLFGNYGVKIISNILQSTDRSVRKIQGIAQLLDK